MRHTTRLFLLLALVLVAGSGGCTLSAEADVPDVTVTQHDLSFTGIPMAGRLGDVATELSFTQDKPALDLPKGLDTSVKAVQVDLIAKGGISSFDFIRSLRVSMIPTSGTDLGVELLSYERADGVAVGSTLSIPSKNPINILDQWKASSAQFTIQIAGTLPEQDWSLDMSVHFSGKFSYKY